MKTTGNTIIVLAECPHACVNKLLVQIALDSNRQVTGVSFGGHALTHDEWTGRPYPKEESHER